MTIAIVLQTDRGMRNMAKFEFDLSTEDTERLFYLKQKNGKSDLTGNEYAEKLLHMILYKECPGVPVRNEDGDYFE